MNSFNTAFAHPTSSAMYHQLLQRSHVRFKTMADKTLSNKVFQATYFKSNYRLTDNDPMLVFFQQQKLLWQQGKPVWGIIVLADPKFFSEEKEVGFGLLLHPAKADQFVHPDALRYFDNQLMLALDEIENDPFLTQIKAISQGGTHRFFNQPVPKTIAPNIDLGLTSICLDKRKIQNQPFFDHPFPALMMEKAPHLAMLLPHWSWEKAMFNFWQQSNG